MKTIAIYLPDVEYEEIPIFEKRDNKFVCVDEELCWYDEETILSDDNWIILEYEEEIKC